MLLLRKSVALLRKPSFPVHFPFSPSFTILERYTHKIQSFSYSNNASTDQDPIKEVRYAHLNTLENSKLHEKVLANRDDYLDNILIDRAWKEKEFWPNFDSPSISGKIPLEIPKKYLVQAPPTALKAWWNQDRDFGELQLKNSEWEWKDAQGWTEVFDVVLGQTLLASPTGPRRPYTITYLKQLIHYFRNPSVDYANATRLVSEEFRLHVWQIYYKISTTQPQLLKHLSEQEFKMLIRSCQRLEPSHNLVAIQHLLHDIASCHLPFTLFHLASLSKCLAKNGYLNALLEVYSVFVKHVEKCRMAFLKTNAMEEPLEWPIEWRIPSYMVDIVLNGVGLALGTREALAWYDEQVSLSKSLDRRGKRGVGIIATNFQFSDSLSDSLSSSDRDAANEAYKHHPDAPKFNPHNLPVIRDIFPPFARSTLRVIFSSWIRDGQIDKARSLLEKMDPHPWLYQQLCFAYVRAGDLDSAKRVFSEEVKNVGLKPTRSMYESLLEHLIVASTTNRQLVSSSSTPYLIQARELFEHMTLNGIEPASSTYEIFVRAYSKTGDTLKIQSLLKEMRDRQIVPTQKLLDNVILAYLMADNVEKAERVFLAMQAPTVYTFGIFLQHAIGRRDYQRINNLILSMPDYGIQPNVKMYGMLIHVHALAGDAQGCKHVLSEMREKGLRPNHVAWGSTIHSYCNIGDLQGAVQCLYDMNVLDRLVPNQHIFHHLLLAFAQNGDTNSCEKIYEEMKARGLGGDDFTWNIMLQAYERRRRLLSESKTPNLIIERQPERHATSQLLNYDGSMVGSQDAVSMLSRTEAFVQNMSEQVPGSNLMEYWNQVSANQSTGQVRKILEEMIQQYPNNHRTWSSMDAYLLLLYRKRRFSRIIEDFEELCKVGMNAKGIKETSWDQQECFKVTSSSIKTLVYSMLKRGSSLTEVIPFLNHSMTSENLELPPVHIIPRIAQETWNKVLNQALQSQDWNLAQELLDSMTEHRVLVDKTIDHQLLDMATRKSRAVKL